MKTRISDQLELGLAGRSRCRTAPRSATKANASFWFARMHQIVDRAIDLPHLPEAIQQQFIPRPGSEQSRR